MYLIGIINSITSKTYGATFDDIEQANSWINSHKKKNTWGLPEREVTYQEHEAWHPKAKELLRYTDGRVKCLVPSDYEIIIEEVHGVDPSEIVWERLRKERVIELEKSDKTQLSDFPLPSSDKTLWREYRTYLRNITLQYDNITIYKYEILSFKDWKMWKHGK